MRTLFRSLLIVGAMAGTAVATPRGAAAATADGLWSVLIVTQSGLCDRGYRYPIRISHGRVTHADGAGASFAINGRVRGSSIRVTVSRGSQSATGNGRIGHNSGGGTWRSAGGECSGNWTAERRS